ncbi:hypothetical protein [Apilactobacillus xinyiensis]|uniref:hypothetical protein n=1 Tax=Apilactobacillus xinyiensis TaxID=2841032 RepID=UPI00200F5305|nr:hypothetical protein [Apilactobacillus xinyiensis]MCL0318596.1 hypothetical protein [Apilactobacillus xinyiensis]
MLIIFKHYRGSQITIPIHLYDRRLAARQVLKKYDGSNLKNYLICMDIYRKMGSIKS